MAAVRLTIDAHLPLTGVVRLFLEQTAAPVIGERGVAGLARAGEELFTYVAEQSPGIAVQFVLQPRPYAALLDISFDSVRFSPELFNLTRSVSLDDDAVLADLPLLLAARSVDRFDLSLRAGEPVRVRLQRDRVYPPPVPVVPPRVTGGVFRAVAGTPDLLRYFAGLLMASVPLALVPDLARHGDRLADVVTAGEVAGVLAVNAEGQVGGGILWRTDAERTVSVYGPYVLLASEPGAAERVEIATLLVEACIGALSRTKLRGLFSRHVTDDLPWEYFERLGSLRATLPGQPEITAVYRSLQEDRAAAVWADPSIAGFLEAFYDAFALAREIRPVRLPDSGVSVLGVSFDRAAGVATIRPILAGADATANVAAHVGLLAQEPMLLAELDLGRSGDATFIPAFLAGGFVPRYLLPSAGTEDVLVMQHAADAP